MSYFSVTYDEVVIPEALRTAVVGLEAIQLNIRPEKNVHWQWASVLYRMYWMVASILLWRFLRSLYLLYRLYAKAEIVRHQGHRLAYTGENHTIYSFLNVIFIGRDGNIPTPVYRHELMHVRKMHTLDILFVEILRIIFWINPAFALYKYYLQEVHEFEADREVLQNYSSGDYKNLLLSRLTPQVGFRVVHTFYSNHIRNRLLMMNQHKSSPVSTLTYASLIPLMAFLILFFGCQSDQNDVEPIFSEENPPPSPPPAENSDELFTIVDEMPRFPGCEEMEGDIHAKEKCAQKKLLEFLYRNIKYTPEGKENGTEGTVVIQFVVEKDGRISNTKIIKDIGDGCGEEALRVVDMMKTMEEKWTPGMQDGQAVRVQLSLPVKYKLN